MVSLFFKTTRIICSLSILLTMGFNFAQAQHPISNALHSLTTDGDFEKAKKTISRFTDKDVVSLPDSTIFDYYYLKGAIAQNDGDLKGKLTYLTAAKMLCEYSLGIHDPVYLELCWTLGKDLARAGEIVSAFEIYQSALIQSIGLYDTSDSDVAWQYAEIEDKVFDWYKNDSIRSAMLNHRPRLRPRPIKEAVTQNDIEFYQYFQQNEALREKLQHADSRYADNKYQAAANSYIELGNLINDNPIAKATINELAALNLLNINGFRRAEELLLENVKLLDQYKSTKVYRRTLSQLSNLYNTLHNYDKAMDYISQAKFWYEHSLDFGRGYILCLQRCAALERGKRKYFMAIVHEDVAIQELYKNSNWGDTSGVGTEKDNFLADMLSSASVFYNDAGFSKDARTLVNSAISISETHGWDSSVYYNNLAQVCLADKDYESALIAEQNAFNRCVDTRRQVEIGTELGIMQYMARKPIDQETLKMVTQGLNKQTAEVFAYLSTDERRDYWTYFQYHLPMLNFLMYQCDDHSLYGSIYNNILQEKGLLLRTSNHIKQSIYDSGNKEDWQAYGRLLELRQKQLLQPQDKSLSAEMDQIDKLLTKKYATFSEFSTTQTTTWETIANKLKADEIAIEFYNIPEANWNGNEVETLPRYCAVTIKNGYDAPHIIPICRKDDLEKLIDNDEIYDDASAYKLIWKPLESELSGTNNVFFAADGDLHRIAIEYLQMPDGKRMTDKYNIYRLSSTRVIAEPQRQTTAQNAVLYGGLKYDLTEEEIKEHSRSSRGIHASRSGNFSNFRYGVSYLPKTLKEVHDIDSLLTGKTGISVQMITGPVGTEESIKALAGKSIDILHLATHGFFWAEDKAEERNYVSFLSTRDISAMRQEDYALLRSGLFFSGANIGLKGEKLPDNVEDGVLTAQELSTMNLGNVDLVVMSACKSGLGETTGEGVFGLQRGFKLAGAKSLLMSLWKVDDEATCLLMTEFYKNLLSGKSKQASLCQAQVTLRHNPQYSAPEFWAGFVLLDALD